jgi:inosine-uridine nucleoside N-ribohydrolase
MAIKKIIIDTDPGIDDVLAILFALAARPEDGVEVLLFSVTFGNIDVKQ